MAASAQGIRAGRAHVSLGVDDNALIKGLRNGQSMLKWGAVSFAPFGAGIKLAGDMAETTSKLDAVFKGNAESVTAWGTNFAAEVGRSKKQALDFLSDVGAVFSGFGFSTDQLTDLSEKITALSVDLGSFFNVADDTALQSLISGLVGESEPLKKFGLIVQDAQTKAELLSQGFDPDNATDMQKVMARFNLILKGTKDAQGDATRTAGSFNNQMKSLQGTITDLAVDIGEALLPAATKVITTIKKFIAPVAAFVKANQGLVLALGSAAAGVLAVGAGLVVLGPLLAAAGSLVAALATGVAALLSPIGLVVAAVAGMGIAFLVTSGKGAEALGWLGGQFNELKERAVEAFGGIADAMAAGDLQLAAEILWAAINVEWVKGTEFIKGVWQDALNWIQDLWENTSATIGRLWQETQNGIARAAIDTGAAIQSAWVNFTSWLGTAFGDALATVHQQWNGLLAALFNGMGAIANGFADMFGDIGGLGDKALEAADARARELGMENQRIAKEREFAHAANPDRDRRLAAIEAGRQGAIAALPGPAAQGGRAPRVRGEDPEGKRRLEDAQNNLRDLLIRAAHERLGAEAEAAGKGKGGGKLSGLAGAAEGMKSVMKETEVVGSFNAAAFRGLGAGSTLTKLENEARRTNELLREINMRARDGRLVFTA